MARLFPPDPEGGRGPEGRLASLLVRALGPDEDHWIWFRPTLPAPGRGLRPSLVLLGLPYGLFVLEVAPWRRSEITGGTARSLLVRQESVLAAHRPRPEVLAKAAAEFLTARLRSRGEPRGPLSAGWGAAYPNLSRAEVDRLGAEGLLDPGRTLAREDLTAKTVMAALARLAPKPPAARLELPTRERIRALIEPQLHFLDLRESASVGESAVGEAGGSTAGPPMPLMPAMSPLPGFWLDRKQERMARELASPRTLVYGPAGSGKTVFLVARAQYWLDRKPDARVLFTCYNASLASHLRGIFAAKGLPPDDTRLTVRHYHDLCGRFLGLSDIHEQPPDFYAALEPRVLRELAVRENASDYDCILVDEGQDFTRRMIEVLVRWNASGGEITVVCDPAQDVYGRWRPDNLGPLRDPAVEHLVDCYRNTAPIFALALEVLPAETRRTMGLSRLELTRPEDLGRDGPPPELRRLLGLDDLVSLLADLAREFERGGRPISDLAVLYPDRGAIRDFPDLLRKSRWRAAADPRYLVPAEEEASGLSEVVQGTLHPTSDRDDVPPSDRPHFAEALELELRARGIPAEWISRDFASKAGYDITRPRLTLSTVHSAKGMDFHTVVLLGAESLSVKPGRTRERAQALLFTGITRARERLILPYFESEGWVPEIAARLRL